MRAGRERSIKATAILLIAFLCRANKCVLDQFALSASPLRVAHVNAQLPKSQPELRYTNCAVVGNGASLGADSAAAIDAADAVLRMNSAPLIP